jgi:predicted lactoylglutathione lyase
MGQQSRRIYVNLPVGDVAASVAYFRSLGFAFADESDNSAAMIVSDHAYVMLLSEERFADFATQAGTEAILCVTAPTRDAVNRFADAAAGRRRRARKGADRRELRVRPQLPRPGRAPLGSPLAQPGAEYRRCRMRTFPSGS